MFREIRACDIPADSVSSPFASPQRFTHARGFQVPDQAVYGVYQVRSAVRDRKGKTVGHNVEEFEVVPKKLKP